MFISIWRIILNEVILRNNVLPVLCGCDVLVASEPFYHSDRITDFNVLIYVTNGTIYVTEDNMDYSVSKGELLFLKKGVQHFGKKEIPHGTRWYYIHFNTCDSNDLPPFKPDSSEIVQYSKVEFQMILPKKLSGLEGSDFERRLINYVEYFHSDNAYRRWLLNVRLFELLSCVSNEFSHSVNPTLSDRIAAYLSENLNKPFCAETLSREFFLSYKRMAAVFKKEKGVSMQQYHNSLRMSEAKRLLRSTLMSVGEIATELGYSDMLYFSRCFHKCTDYCPTEYRKLPQTY